MAPEVLGTETVELQEVTLEALAVLPEKAPGLEA
jgi:hypothetical protein